MKLLALDTSTDACSVALQIGDQVLTDHRVAAQQHGALVLSMIDSLMSEAGIAATQLNALIYGRGPGSFTGVRIGVACAQGIALGADVGVTGVSTLQSIAQGAYREYGDTHVSVSVDARMDEVYYCEYQLGGKSTMKATVAEKIGAPQDFIPLNTQCWAGSGAERYSQYLMDQTRTNALYIRKACLPQACDLLTLGIQNVLQDELQAPELAMPVYLRNKVALTTAERTVRM